MSTKEAITEKRSVCCHCTVHCGVLVTFEEDRPVAIKGDPSHPVTRGFICKKGLAAIDYFQHPDRLDHPLKRVGERGEGRWVQLSWEEALDEIAERLRAIIQQDGPEAVTYTCGTAHATDNGAGVRFLNHLGSPNTFGAGLICLGPQLIAHALTFGFGPAWPAVIPGMTRAVLVWAQQPSASNPPAWGRIMAAKRAGTKLVVIDSRRTQEAETADLWLRPRPGTDAALALAMLHVIIAENLYDREFVEQWIEGFAELRQRVQDYPPQKVSEITGVPAEDIVEAARLYATSRPAVISSGTPNGMGRNCLNFERGKACLIAICGNLDAIGGNMMVGPPRDVLTIPDIDDNGALSTEQQGKRLGADKFRLLGEGYERLNEAMRRVWTGHDYLVYSSMGRAAHAPTVWRTILSQQPYPVRAVIVQQHNILGSYPNTQIAYQALKSPNLQLLVVHEQFMTATAQLADYVLPAAGWLEKPYMYVGGWDVRVLATPRAVQPQGERRDDYQLFADLARRLGQEDLWPPDLEALYDYMLAPAERNFQELASQEQNWFASEKAFPQHLQPDPQTGQPLGFGTPSGKVEIASNILAGLGYDPLPGYEEPMRPAFGDAEQYPFLLGTGAAVIEFMHQDHRQISSLRKRHPEPQVEIAPETAAGLGIAEGDWVWVETPSGKVRQRAKLSPGLHPQLIVAERWWYPERKGEEPDLYGLWESNINAYTEDDPDLCDPAYGNWPFRLGRCRVYKD